MMGKVGILAYGSLIDAPGEEIRGAIYDCIDCRTPFPIEFARKSKKRRWAPTLVPYDHGEKVNAKILMVNLPICEVRNRLYRREIYDDTRSTPYPIRPNPKANDVVVNFLCDFEDIDIVFYAAIGANINDLTAAKLARLAISSAQSKAGIEERDGITYLINAKKNGITTPLSERYEAEIKRITGKRTLKEALCWCLRRAQ